MGDEVIIDSLDIQSPQMDRLEAYLKIMAESSHGNSLKLQAMNDKLFPETNADLPAASNSGPNPTVEQSKKRPITSVSVEDNFELDFHSDSNLSNPHAKSSSSKGNYNKVKGKKLASANISSESRHKRHCYEVDPENDELNEIDCLEDIMMGVSESADKTDSELESDNDFLVIGDEAAHKWSPPRKAFSWYKKVADIDLKQSDLTDLKEKYLPPSEVANHFEPPKLPPSLWQNICASPGDTYKHKVIYKAQDNIFGAIKPLLSVLESLSEQGDHELKNKVASSVQMLCSSNLTLNRLRRALVAPHLSHEYRKSLLSLPVKHNALFGSSFEKTMDEITKEKSSTKKMFNLSSKPSTAPVRNRNYRSNYQTNNPPTSNQYTPNERSQQPFRGSQFRYRRGRARGKFRGYSSSNSFKDSKQ